MKLALRILSDRIARPLRVGLRIGTLSGCLALSPLSANAATYTFTTIDVPGAISTAVFGINGNGQIVGDFSKSVGSVQGFIYDAGTFTTINVPSPATSTIAAGINNSGQIVGWYFAPAPIRAFSKTAPLSPR